MEKVPYSKKSKVSEKSKEKPKVNSIHMYRYGYMLSYLLQTYLVLRAILEDALPACEHTDVGSGEQDIPVPYTLII